MSDRISKPDVLDGLDSRVKSSDEVTETPVDDTTRDDSKIRVLGRIKQRPLMSAAIGFLLIVAVTAFLLVVPRFIGFVTKPIFYGPLVVIVIIFIIHTHGRKTQRSIDSRKDELKIQYPHGTESLEGELKFDNGLPEFEPIAGYGLFNIFNPRYLSVSEVSEDLTSMANKKLSGDDNARIRLHEGVTSWKDTDDGTVVVTRSGGLEIDQGGTSSSAMVATLPDDVSEDEYLKLAEELDKTWKSVRRLQDELETERQQKEDWKSVATERFEDTREITMDTIERVLESMPSQQSQQPVQPYGQLNQHLGGDDDE